MKKILFALFLSLPIVAKANVVWPSLYITDQYYTWYVILAALIVELLAIKFFTKCSWARAGLMDITMNAISALLGWILIPISGIIVEILLLPFGGGTFDISHWIFAYIFVVLTNGLVEGLSLKLIFKMRFKGVFWWLCAANAISVILSVFVRFDWD